MLQRWNKAFTHLSRLGSQRNLNFRHEFYVISRQSYKKAAAAAAAVAPTTADTAERRFPSETAVSFRAALCVFM